MTNIEKQSVSRTMILNKQAWLFHNRAAYWLSNMRNVITWLQNIMTLIPDNYDMMNLFKEHHDGPIDEKYEVDAFCSTSLHRYRTRFFKCLYI